ncbi:alpha-1,2-fucosyltransferase [Helicobacter burdigaliensis]
MKNGYDKSYDITFDIPKAFPKIKCDIATKEEIEHYRKRYFIDDEEVARYIPPLYVGGYLGRNYSVKFKNFLIDNFVPKEVEESNTAFYLLLTDIMNTDSCGIHIRRGDLAKPHFYYGNPISVDYFAKNIELVLKLQPKTTFYLFSDDLQWIEKYIVPLFGHSKFRICNVNSADKGYLDLYLLSKCKLMIGSQGSMARFAKILSPSDPLLIVPRQIKMKNTIATCWNEDDIHEGYKADPVNLTILNKIRLKLFKYLRNKLMQKGIL